jgi:alkanesulfonate monooxygenase SsuD/methylene tetrahydromethanopterin reductase-like flavin-dependent oxidoreductase (luciferase family)
MSGERPFVRDAVFEVMMRFGICYNVEYREDVHKSPSNYLGQILEQVDVLERAGFDSVWFSEHHCAGYSFGNPAVIAASAASRTKRIRIGTGVSLLPLHHPIFLAEQYGLLDVLSNGRLEYGIGRGYLMHEYDWLKIPRGESHERYREAAEFIVKAWTSSGPMDFHGKHFDVDGYTYSPRPVQRPIPPIYASAGGTMDSFRWAGEMGFHLGTALFLPDLGKVAESIALYRKTLAEHGHDPASREIMAITQMYCDDDHDKALADGKVYAENYYRFFANLSGASPNNPVYEYYSKANALEMNARNQLLLGGPENLVQRIGELRQSMGLDFLLMEVAQGGAPHDKICQALELFAKKVMPKFQVQKRVAVG